MRRTRGASRTAMRTITRPRLECESGGQPAKRRAPVYRTGRASDSGRSLIGTCIGVCAREHANLERTVPAIWIHNDGQRFAATSYFGSEHARRGLIYLSVNAGGVPDSTPSSCFCGRGVRGGLLDRHARQVGSGGRPTSGRRTRAAVQGRLRCAPRECPSGRSCADTPGRRRQCAGELHTLHAAHEATLRLGRAGDLHQFVVQPHDQDRWRPLAGEQAEVSLGAQL